MRGTPKATRLVLAAALVAAAGAALAQGKPLWRVSEHVDKMTDKRECMVQYAPSPDVLYDADGNLVVSRYGRGGVRAFQYRLDARPATALQLVDTTRETDRSFIRIYDANDEISGASKMLVRGAAIVGGPFEMTIDLRGLRQARDEMQRRCGVPAKDTWPPNLRPGEPAEPSKP